jgi:hypothetical protein
VQFIPIMGPFYQLMRQHLLAAYCRRHEPVDEVYVACIGFRGNMSLHEVPANLRHLGTSVEDAWNACLRAVPPMTHTDVEDIMARAKMSPRTDRAWLAYLDDRYGL